MPVNWPILKIISNVTIMVIYLVMPQPKHASDNTLLTVNTIYLPAVLNPAI